MLEHYEKQNDIPISLIKLLHFCDHQINYYQDEMDKMQLESTSMYILNKPDRDFRDLVCQQEEWKYIKQHMMDRASTILY
tara:strand:- start:1012 stop:1251 length:240 start_codon:yes stop_codon:yes gene_type:complete